jgi:hypothetical protein
LLDESSSARYTDAGEPYFFFSRLIDRLVSAGPAAEPARVRGLSARDTVYLSFIRTFAALDGRIGTALTQIALLPYLRDRLGVTVFLSLPTGVIGVTNRKGVRGSPFAVADPFAIDPSLADPLLPELSAEVQYRALVQACHALGLRAGSVVPMATLAIDSPLFACTPQLGYWWDGDPTTRLCAPAASGSASALGRPPTPDGVVPASPERFVEVPASHAVDVLATPDRRRFFATNVGERQLTLANAFPLPGGITTETTTWGDVAMVNYTARCWPIPVGTRARVDDDPSRPAWSVMSRALGWRHEALGEEVFLIDANPSVPPGVLELARELASDDGAHITFIGEELWSFDTPSAALDAVVGPLVYGVSAHSRNLELLTSSLRYHLRCLEDRRSETPFLAATANHDTLPPTPEVASLLTVCYAFLPGAVPCIYSGTEVYADVLTNEEFGSWGGDSRAGARDHELALFDDLPLAWDSLPTTDLLARPVVDMPELLSHLNRLRRALRATGPWDYRFVTSDSQLCFGYELRRPAEPNDFVRVTLNWDPTSTAAVQRDEDAVTLASVNAGGETPGIPGVRYLAPSSAMVTATSGAAIRLLQRGASVASEADTPVSAQ